jgi:putative glutamine amidotransferase
VRPQIAIPKVAIPQPTSGQPEYNARAFPQYAEAVRRAGGEPVEIPLGATPAEVAKLASQCAAVLLPGSSADVDPEKYGEQRGAKTAAADPQRDNVDELLIQDAYNLRKPLLGICYGMQILNVWRTGTLRQHLATGVDHEAGKTVLRAHQAAIAADSILGSIVAPAVLDTMEPSIVPGEETSEGHGPVEEPETLVVPINSSHHQAAERVGDGLRAVAHCPEDGVIEAVEGTQPEHFVLGVQWHPERTYDEEPVSRALFAAFIGAASRWKR